MPWAGALVVVNLYCGETDMVVAQTALSCSPACTYCQDVNKARLTSRFYRGWFVAIIVHSTHWNEVLFLCVHWLQSLLQSHVFFSSWCYSHACDNTDFPLCSLVRSEHVICPYCSCVKCVWANAVRVYRRQILKKSRSWNKCIWFLSYRVWEADCLLLAAFKSCLVFLMVRQEVNASVSTSVLIRGDTSLYFTLLNVLFTDPFIFIFIGNSSALKLSNNSRSVCFYLLARSRYCRHVYGTPPYQTSYFYLHSIINCRNQIGS